MLSISFILVGVFKMCISSALESHFDHLKQRLYFFATFKNHIVLSFNLFLVLDGITKLFIQFLVLFHIKFLRKYCSSSIEMFLISCIVQNTLISVQIVFCLLRTLFTFIFFNSYIVVSLNKTQFVEVFCIFEFADYFSNQQ